MHETHLIAPVIKAVSEHAKQEGAAKVTQLRLKVGQFCGIKDESFRQTFSLLAKGTLLEDAALEITSFPGSRIEVISFDVD